MSKQGEFELSGGKAARDEALQRVLANAGERWIDIALHMLRTLPYDTDFTAEDYKLRIIEDGCPLPHHHNAWGSLTGAAIKLGIIYFTGRYTHMKVKRSHARKTPIYRRKRRHDQQSLSNAN